MFVVASSSSERLKRLSAASTAQTTPLVAASVSANGDGAGAGRATLAAFAARGRSIASNVNFKFVMVSLS